ncbi:MAG: ECF transporter S component [Clostridia bacterium]|nr:ECF transporter S component [Clostridia bacterium]
MVRSDFSAEKLRRIVLIALFGAISYVLMLVVHLPVSFLTMDVKDVIITLCGLYFGPLSALLLSVIVPLMELITGMSSTGLYGLVMNILGTAAFSVVTSLIYKYRKSFVGAIVGLVSGVCAMVAVMMAFNLLITPYYMGVTVAEVQALIPTLLFPFNLVKGTLNAGLVLFLYKPLSGVLQRAGALPPSEARFRFNLRTVLVMLASLILIGISLFVVIRVLGGSFVWGF